MKTHPYQWLNVMLLLALLLPIAGHPTAAALSEDMPTTSQVAAPVAESVDETLRNSPVMFIENIGQFDGGARFQVRGGNSTLWLADDALWITILEPMAVSDQRSARSGLSPAFPFDRDPESEIENRQGVNLRLSFPNANPNPRLEPFDRLETTVSYFLGNDPDGWRPAVPVWGGVRYVDLYPGIDLEVTSEGGQFVQRLHVQPGADLSQVRLRVEGAEVLTLDGNCVHFDTVVGEYVLPLINVHGLPKDVIERANVQYGGVRTFDVVAPFTPSSPDLATFNPQSSDLSQLLYSTFLGGSDSERANDIAVDGSGAAYVAGYTFSVDFPTTPGAFTTIFGGYADAFVVKVTSNGSDLVYAALLGGSGGDYGYGIAVDGSGAVYVTGDVQSSDFPTTAGAFDTIHNGECDTFVAKVTPDGKSLAYSTFLGGHDTDYGRGDIAVDGSGASYVTGWTWSTDFPTTPGAFDTTYNGSNYPNAFVVKVAPNGSSLVYATFLGRNNGEMSEGIVVDGSGAAYVVGSTTSADFPTTPGAFDTTYGGSIYGSDGFVVKFDTVGSTLVYSTFLGGSGLDYGFGVASDGTGAAYVMGYTYSSDFPTTPGAFDVTRNGNADVFVVKVTLDGGALAYSTFLGGSGTDNYGDIAVDGSGAVYVTGYTASLDFPITPGALDTTLDGSSDAFVAKLTSGGSTLAYSTFLGGSSAEGSWGIKVDGSGIVYISGDTYSADFPTTPGAFDTSFNGDDGDTFVMKLSISSVPEVTSSGSLTLLTDQTISLFRSLSATAQVQNTGATQQEFNLTFRLLQDSAILDARTFTLSLESGVVDVQTVDFGLCPIGRYRVEATLSVNETILTTQSREVLVLNLNAQRIILDYADDLQATAHSELDDIAYISSWALSDELLSFGLDYLEGRAISKFADLAAPIQEAGDIPLSTSDDAITQIQDILGRARLYRQNLATAIRLYVNDIYGITLPNGFDPLNPDLDFITDPILKDRIKNWLVGYLADFFSDKIISPLWINGPRNTVDDRHIAFENFLLLHPVSEEPRSLAGQMQRGQNRIRNVVEGDAIVTLGPYDVLGHTLQYDLTLQEQENKRQQIDEFGDTLKLAIAVLVVIGVVIILLLIVGAISSGGVLAAIVGPIIWKIVKVLFTIGKKIVPIARALLVASMLFTVSLIAPHVPQYHDETLDAAETLIIGSGKVLLRTFNVAVQSEQVRLTAQLDGPETGKSQVLVETALYSVDGRIINIVWSTLEIQAGQQATLNKDIPLAPGTYRAVTTLYAEGDVTAVKTSPFQVAGLEVKLDLRLSQSRLDLGDPVAATVILTNTSIISDVNDLTLILESSDGTNFDAWPVSLTAGETQQIDYTFTPTMTEAYVLRAWLGVGFNTVAQQDAAYIVGAGPAVALNTNVSDVYTPGLTVTLPLTLTNVGDTATTVAVTVQTMDRLQTGIVIFSSTLTATVPPSDTIPAMAIALPDAQPGLYSAWLALNGTAYDAWDFAVAATDTLFGLLTVGELYVDMGQSVPVTATISSADDTLTDATITVTVQSPSQTITTLPMTWVDNGTYRTDFTPAISGTYSLELAVARENYRTVGDQSFFIAEMSTLLIPAIKGQPQVGEIRPVSVTVNSETGIPISGVTVILSGTEEILRSETDETGCVVLQTFPPDVCAYVLTTERMGYAGATTEVAVGWFQVYLPLVLRNH